MTTKIRNIVGPIFHVAAFLHHVYASIYQSTMIDVNVVTDQKVLDVAFFAPVFFTTWNMVIQTVYFAIATFYDILTILSIKPQLRDKIIVYRGYIFTTLFFPFSLLVSTCFWGVYSVNREWVLPAVLDDYIPGWLNHFFHTNILIFAIIEVLIVNQLLPTVRSAFIGLTTLVIVYHILLFASYAASGRWAYGLLYIFNWPERFLFLFSNYVFSIVMMRLGIYIENFKHSLVRKSSKKL